MDRFLRENLEAYLAGQLGQSDRREFDARMAARPNDRAMVQKMAHLSQEFELFDLPEEAAPGPSPSFCAQVLQRIEEEARPAVWDWLLQPLVVRRVAYVAVAWILALVSGSVTQSAANPAVDQLARSVLAEAPESEYYCNVRMGCDIDVNRSSMLAVVMVRGGSDR